ncbi:MAG TPA: glycosyltransferase family 2 protein [Steroidobacteraceae bacterium]|nr:glycosyltransferase family 2 protein [Steroidobacteraceae bacterium]
MAVTRMVDIEVAVVIVSYKSAAVAVDCLASIDAERRRPGPRIRVVVVDNASGDLPEIQRAVDVNAWSSWVQLVLAPRNGGFAYGNNLGIRHAYEAGRPTYVYLLNPDTEVRPGAIRELVEFLESHPQASIAGGSFETESGAPWPFAFRFPGLLSELDHGLRLSPVSRLLASWTVPRVMRPVAQATDWVSGAAMMIRPGVLAAVGCLDESFFLYFEETEFCHRARRAGFRTWYVPQSRIMHMIGQSTKLDDEARIQRRLPGYWFASRARYFVATRGLPAALLIDLVTVIATALGILKQKALRRPITPHYLRDLMSHSPWLRRNRAFEPLKSYFPGA